MGKLIRQKQEAGELATQGRPINVPDGNIYQTLPDIGITWGSSSDRSRRRGSWQMLETRILLLYQARIIDLKPSPISE
jgi:hypothetical protein